MAKQTDNYNFTVPESTDFADVTVISNALEAIDATLAGKADLKASGTIPTEQIPALDYISTSEKGEANGVASLDTKGVIPKAQLPELNYISASEKASPNGVASLDAKGIVPKAQLPTLGLLPQILVDGAANATVTATDGTIVVAGAGTPIKKLVLPDYGDWVVSAQTTDGESIPQTITVDTVKQYAVNLTWFAATLSVTCPANATVVAVCGEHQYISTADANGHATMVVHHKGDYEIAYYTDSVGTIPITVTVRINGETYVIDLTT